MASVATIRPAVFAVGLAAAGAGLIGWFFSVATYPLAAAALIAILGVGAVAYGRLGDSFDRYPERLVLASFLLVYPLSGLAHLLGAGEARGFYDIVRGDAVDPAAVLTGAVIATAVAAAGLLAGLSTRLPTGRVRAGATPRWLPALGIVAFLIGVYAFRQLVANAGSLLEFAFTVNRGDDAIPPGLARYVFLSQWMPWGVLFVMVGLSRTAHGRRKRRIVPMLILYAVVAVASSFWTGSRVVVIVAVLPGTLWVLRSRLLSARILILSMAVAMVGYFALLTILRAGTQAQAVGGAAVLLDVIDWQIGRFSMIGLFVAPHPAIEHSVTILGSGIVDALNTALTAFGLGALAVPNDDIAASVGQLLFGNRTINGTLAGMVGQLYFVGGDLGVFLGFILLGWLARVAGGQFRRAQGGVDQLFWSYIIVLLAASAIPTAITGWLYFLTTIGLPMTIAFALAKLTPVRRP